MDKKYKAIIIDPPWEYNSPRTLVGNGGRGDSNIENITQVDVSTKYKTMSLAEIKSIRMPYDKSGCLLFMWVTNPFLCDGSGPEIVKSWGFTPKSIITWAKVQIDGVTPSMKTGHWFRSASEHVIFAVHGNLPRPSDFKPIPTWFPYRRAEHSVKPDRIHEIVETMTVGPYLEIFARRLRVGWDSWGDAVGIKVDTSPSSLRSNPIDIHAYL